jgi:hypothetical protein
VPEPLKDISYSIEENEKDDQNARCWRVPVRIMREKS